jgi:site-specific recombinase XerD
VRQKGLAPSTINVTLSLIKEFFDFLREEGERQVQPVIRRRHRLCTPGTLPKPMRLTAKFVYANKHTKAKDKSSLQLPITLF